MSEQEKATVGEIVRRAREAHGLSIAKLAKAAGVDPRWVSRLEQGIYSQPDPRGLHRLAGALDLETEELFMAADYSDGLPNFAPYLRLRYELPDNAIEQLQAYFDLLADKYDKQEGGGDEPNNSTAA